MACPSGALAAPPATDSAPVDGLVDVLERIDIAACDSFLSCLDDESRGALRRCSRRGRAFVDGLRQKPMKLAWSTGWADTVRARLPLLARFGRVTELRLILPLLQPTLSAGWLEEVLAPLGGGMDRLAKLTSLKLVLAPADRAAVALPWSLPAAVAALFPSLRAFSVHPGARAPRATLPIPVPELFYAGLRTMGGLRRLELGGCTPDAVAHLHLLAPLPHLDALVLAFPEASRLSAAAAASICALCGLSELELRGCVVGWAEGRALLAGLPPRLQRLQLTAVCLYEGAEPRVGEVAMIGEPLGEPADFVFDIAARSMQVQGR